MEKDDALRVKPSFMRAGVVSDGGHSTNRRVVVAYHGEAACGGLDRNRDGRAHLNDERDLVTAVVAVTLRVGIGQALSARDDQRPCRQVPGLRALGDRCGGPGLGRAPERQRLTGRAHGRYPVGRRPRCGAD